MTESRKRRQFNFDVVADIYDSAKYIIGPAERLAMIGNLKPDGKILDVACGTGWATIGASKIVGASGEVIGIDLSLKMLEIAMKKTASAGISNIKYLEGNAEALEFEEASFDNVICASSIFLLSDAENALSEWYRVLKPGGTVAFNTFGQDAFHPVSEIFHDRMVQFEEESTPRRRFSLAEPDQCKELLDNAGLINTKVINEDLGIYLGDKEDCWKQISNELAYRQRVASLSPTKLEAFKNEFLKDIDHLLTDQGIWVSLPVNFCIGEKPV